MTKKHPDILNTAFPNEIFGKDVKEFEAPPLTGKQKIGFAVIILILIGLVFVTAHYDAWFINITK